MVTAGPTEEDLDPVRFLSNHSSGKMGYALARAARRRGAEVILVSGPTSLPPPAKVKLDPGAVGRGNAGGGLSSFREGLHPDHGRRRFRLPAPTSGRPKNEKGIPFRPCLELERNPDILLEAGKAKGNRIFVGFAAETQNLLKNAKEKLAKKNLDLIVANDVSLPGAGFRVDTNIVKVIERSGRVEKLPLMSKEDLADRILERILALRKK